MITAARILVVAAVLGGLSGCTGVAATEAGGDPFAGFPPCEPPDAQGAVAAPAVDVPGLVLPEDAVVISTTRTGPITDVTAYVPRTPIEVRAFYEDVHDDVEVLQLEDEVFETEVLLAHGALRSYLIARTACREGSSITGFIAPEHAVADLPTGQVGSR
jgi:hypothetical protein